MQKYIFNSKPIEIPKHLKNAKEWPKQYRCRFIEPGLVSYQDCGAGVALVTKETLDKMLNSIIGKPVIIQHSDVSPQNMKEHAIGYVTNAYYEPFDGWYYCEFLITDDKGHAFVRSGASVSCGYKVLNTKTGGEWHAIRYDEEITNGEYEHLALVHTPRYEDSRILVNSKSGKIYIETDKTNKEDKGMFGFLKKTNGKNEVEKIKTDLTTHFVRLQNGKKVSLKELIDLRNSSKKEEESVLDVEDVLEVDGQELKISELVELHNSKAGKEIDDSNPVKEKWNDLAMKKYNKAFEALNDKEKEDLKKENAEGEEEEAKRIAKEKEDEDAGKKEAAKKKNSEEEEEKKKKENADADEKKKKDEEEQIKKENEKKDKEGQEHFIRLENVRKSSTDEGKFDAPSTVFERVNRGTARYGKK